MSEGVRFIVGLVLLSGVAVLFAIYDGETRARIATYVPPPPKIHNSGPPDANGVVCYWRDLGDQIACVKVK